MRILVLATLLSLGLTTIARGGPEVSAVSGGFKRSFAADTLPATLPKAREAKTVFAAVKVTAVVGEDE